MRSVAWPLSLILCCALGGALLFIVGSILFSSYETQRLLQEETAYPTPEEAFLARHSYARKVEIEYSFSDAFGLWLVCGWVWERDETTGQTKKRPKVNFFASVDGGWVFVRKNPRTFLMFAGLWLQSNLGRPSPLNRPPTN